jgi:plastocyanin
MTKRRRTVAANFLLFTFGAGGAALPSTAWADDAGGDVARLQGELNRVKQEVREQRQMIFQLMQIEQQHYDVLLKYMNSGVGAPADGNAAAPLPQLAPLPTLPASGPAHDGVAAAPALPAREFGTVSGRVKLPGAGAEAYVYVDGMRAAPSRAHTLEIKQRDKQFTPRVSVVQAGTRVIFPNDDTVIHNVFSQNPGNSFDLGSVKSGERSAPVVLARPGHVEVFCNIHSKMKADILVVPNAHWTRVGADGSFSIPGVPTGSRRVVLWSPALKPISQDIEVTTKGGTATFNGEASVSRPHLNKRGQAYGSYDE